MFMPLNMALRKKKKKIDYGQINYEVLKCQKLKKQNNENLNLEIEF